MGAQILALVPFELRQKFHGMLLATAQSYVSQLFFQIRTHVFIITVVIINFGRGSFLVFGSFACGSLLNHF